MLTIHFSDETQYPGHCLAVNWGQVLMEAPAAPHTYVAIEPLPNVSQMVTTRNIWCSFSPLVTSKFSFRREGVNTFWINEAANCMFEASGGELRRQIGIIVADTYSHKKLRILAALGFIGAWWWMREGIVWTLIQLQIPGFRVDDSTVRDEWKKVENALQRLN
jgi:hypothetical protein